MCPLIPVMMNIVRDLAKQDPLRPQYPVSLSQERWKRVGKSIVILLRGTDDESKAFVEVFGLVLSLVRNVRRIVHNHIKATGPERHISIVTHNIRMTLRVDIETSNWPLSASPKPAAVDCCIQYLLGRTPRVEVQHLL